MNPINYFFSLGDKVTKNPVQKATYDYLLLWVMFLAFFLIFVDNIYSFISNFQNGILLLTKLGWSFVILAILWFQYFSLKSAREMYKNLKGQFEIEEPNEQSMLNEFEKREVENGTN